MDLECYLGESTASVPNNGTLTGNPLLALKNVTMTVHAGFMMLEATMTML